MFIRRTLAALALAATALTVGAGAASAATPPQHRHQYPVGHLASSMCIAALDEWVQTDGESDEVDAARRCAVALSVPSEKRRVVRWIAQPGHWVGDLDLYTTEY